MKQDPFHIRMTISPKKKSAVLRYSTINPNFAASNIKAQNYV